MFYTIDMAHRSISCFPVNRVYNGLRLKTQHCRCAHSYTRKQTAALYNFTKNKTPEETLKSNTKSTCKYHQREQFRDRYCNLYFKTSNLQSRSLELNSYIFYNPIHQSTCSDLVYVRVSDLLTVKHLDPVSIRCFHMSHSCLKEESKVEKSVKKLKESKNGNEVKEEEKSNNQVAEPVQTAVVVSSSFSLKLKNIWRKTKEVCSHYYNGFKLLFIDIRVCFRLLMRLWNGHTLTRREYKQMVRTAADVFRLVPFSIFIIIPFMEFFLPLAIKMFPNLLPSTFKEEKTEQEKLKKQLKVKLEIAKFLQDTTEEMPILLSKKSKVKAAEEFSEFIIKARSEGVPVSTEDILKFSKLFEDDITLDSLDRKTLRALCQVLSIPLTNITGNFDTMLRFQLRMKLRELLADDKTTQAKIIAQELVGEKVDNKDKLELIKSEEKRIRKEQLEKQAEKEELERKDREKQQELLQEAVAAESAMTSNIEPPDPAIILEPKPEEELKTAEQEEEEHITSKDLEEIESALEEIAEEKNLDIDKEELEDLKEDISDYKENLEDLKYVIIAQGGNEQDLIESKAAKRLTKRVDRLINQLHGIVDELHLEKEQIQEEIEVGEVKMKRSRELLEDEEKRKEMIDALKEKKGNVISINEMVLALKRLQKVPNDTKLQKIVQVLDEDKDGNIDVTHVLKVIELLGRENVKLSHSQISEVINLLKQETLLEEEERLKEKQVKESNDNMNNNMQRQAQQ
ncbi:hypothetical protein KUTeg_005346 [Tegillarca granosa]|uniref:Mitochondrial proton/calcium exchanger protein n=1 Tax=Tegillarca granosa TaxID=220873 RepID=A0ABQ9FND0_TEGGR|nr:hypothetical protein KUTeg_005346 [Tegillarca granosa]